MNITDLRKKAYQLRIDCLNAFYESEIPSGHIGGCFSEAEIITALYYFLMKTTPENPEDESRDRFILSKGHNCMLLYAALADKGYFRKDVLKTYRADESILQGHPDANKCPGIEITTGSLGQGLSLGVGMALANRIKKNPCDIYVVLGDGEVQSGMVWEAAMAAGHYRLNNMICFIDRNHLEVNGNTEKIMSVEPLEERFQSFGWDVARIDGHDISAIISQVEKAKVERTRPHMIICETVKGKGVSFMENVREWHSGTITPDIYEKSRKELFEALETIQ